MILEKILMKLIRKNPNDFITLIEKSSVDLKKSKDELDIARTLVKERFSMTKDQIDAVEFVFWFAYLVENEVQDLIIEPEVAVGGRKEAIKIIVDKLHFGDKIAIIENLYITKPKKDKLLTMLRKTNDLRNSVAHGRFDELIYGGYKLSDLQGQLKIVTDLMNSMLKEEEAKREF